MCRKSINNIISCFPILLIILRHLRFAALIGVPNPRLGATVID